MKNLVYILAVLMISCSSSKIDKNTAIMSSEAVVLASIKIMNNGKDITKNSKIYFDENRKGTLTYRLPENGEMMTKLPIGNHYIKMIYTPYGSVNLPDGYASFRIDGNKANYIGNIEIKTDDLLSKKFQGAIYDTSPRWKEEKKPKFSVTASDELKKQYQAEFGNRFETQNSLLLLEESY